MIFAGIDAGSRAVKVVLIDADARVVASSAADQSPRPGERTREFYREVLLAAGLGIADVTAAVVTGYARNAAADLGACVTEITCHARGVKHLVPQTRGIIEIGGQDSKVIHLDEAGHVRDFAMNDRCAAGTGQFLEMVADKLHLAVAELGPLAATAGKAATISSMCAVFAETEIIGLLAQGCDASAIAAGVQQAIASRIVSMAGGQLVAPVVFTGGVARIAGMDSALARATGRPITVAPSPQFTGALGAALTARQKSLKA